MQPMNPNPGPDDAQDELLLDGLNNSIGQVSPIEPNEIDPLHGLLDSVEVSVEQGPSTISEYLAERANDPECYLLDMLEDEMEKQVIPPDVPSFEPPSPEPVPEAFSSFQSQPPLPDSGEHFIREYPLPRRLQRASGRTGCKNLDSGGMSLRLGWCQLYGKIVSTVDCEDCEENYEASGCQYWSEA